MKIATPNHMRHLRRLKQPMAAPPVTTDNSRNPGPTPPRYGMNAPVFIEMPDSIQKRARHKKRKAGGNKNAGCNQKERSENKHNNSAEHSGPPSIWLRSSRRAS